MSIKQYQYNEGELDRKLMPWEQLPDVWKTKAEYFQWLRGQMRKAWSHHPIKNAFKMSRRTRAAVGKKINKKTGKPQLVWALPCDDCGHVFPQSDVEVDHIVQAGSFRDWADCESWLMRLMQINFADLQLLCKPCHDVKSYADQYGYTKEEAIAQKAAIVWLDETSVLQQKAYLISTACYCAADVSNAKKRRAAYVQYYLHTQDLIA